MRLSFTFGVLEKTRPILFMYLQLPFVRLPPNAISVASAIGFYALHAIVDAQSCTPIDAENVPMVTIRRSG
jgi:hypothetical protein